MVWRCADIRVVAIVSIAESLGMDVGGFVCSVGLWSSVVCIDVTVLIIGRYSAAVDDLCVLVSDLFVVLIDDEVPNQLIFNFQCEIQ